MLFRGRFWLADQRLGNSGNLTDWPAVVAVIPARNEQDTIAATVNSLLAQNYPGVLDVIVVDDNSDDETGKRALLDARVRVITGAPLKPGWSGKLWAVFQGVSESRIVSPDARYLLLTDADIVHGPDALKRLVSKAETQQLDLVSLMVKLHMAGLWENLLIPAFVFFFQKLYPFPWVNDPDRKTAAAAGGCMLIRRDALLQSGGIEAVHGQLIDDCAIAALMKNSGSRIWLGLADDSISLRHYRKLPEIWTMVARTAYVQLNRSPLNLLVSVLGMVILYLLPVILLATGLYRFDVPLIMTAGGAWLVMALCYLPTVRYYQQNMIMAVLLPVAGLLYTLMTVSSAWRHYHGQGGNWKGRTYGS